MAPERRFSISRRTMWVAIGALVALVASAVVVWRLASGDDRSAAPAIDLLPPPSGMVIDLQRLGGGSSAVSVGSTVPFVVSAAGQAPLAAVELWAGASRVVNTPVDGMPTAARVSFDWQATAGDVVVTARSIDIAGRSAMSNPVRVMVVDAPMTGMASMVEHTVVAGDTLTSLAAQYSTPETMITVANPGAFGPDLVPTVATLQIPVAVTAEQAGVTLPPPGGPSRIGPSIAPPPVDITVDGCTALVSLIGPQKMSGLAAYVLPPDGEMFTLMASGPVGNKLSVPLPSGASNLVVASFDSITQSYGPVQPVSTTADCDKGWTGAVRLEGSRLVSDTTADEAYLYISDGSGWQRVPPSGTVPKRQDAFDFTGLLPETGNGQVAIEAWGRTGGQLTFLGAGQKAAGQSTLPTFPKYVRAQLWWIEKDATSTAPEQLSTNGFAPNPGVLKFRWKASTPQITKFVWQVTSYEPPASAGLDLPGVIAQDTVDATSPVFPIDFSKFAGSKQIPTSSASASMGPMALIGGKVSVPNPGPTTLGPSVAVGPAGATVSKGGATVDVKQLGDLPSLPTPTRFYVRIVPFIGEQFTGHASNAVVIDTVLKILDPSIFEGGPIGQPSSNVYDISLKVTPPQAPNPWMARCWMITEIDPLKFDLTDSYMKSLYPWFTYLKQTQYGGTICPLCYKSGSGSIDFSGYYGYHCAEDDGFDLLDPSTYANFPILGPLITGLIQVGSSVWDFVVELAMYLKSKVVDIVSFLGCKGFVQAGAAAAGKPSPPDAEAVCDTLAEIAVDAALVYAGIPPTLPTFEQAMDGLKGDLAGLVVDSASALGFPCDDIDTAATVSGNEDLTCQALAEKAIDLVVEAVKTAVTASAQSTSGIVFPPGVYAVPHPNGQIKPPSVSVTVTPTAKAPLSGITCPATVVMTSVYFAVPTALGLAKMPDLNSGYDTQLGLWNGLWVKAQSYGGFVVQPTKIDLPTLPNNNGVLSPVTKTYLLDQLTPHDDLDAFGYSYGNLPGNSNNGVQRAVKIPFASMQLHTGAFLTTTVNSACGVDTTVIGKIQSNQQLQVTKVIP